MSRKILEVEYMKRLTIEAYIIESQYRLDTFMDTHSNVPAYLLLMYIYLVTLPRSFT